MFKANPKIQSSIAFPNGALLKNQPVNGGD